MTAANLPGQLELATVIDHQRAARPASTDSREVQIAKLLRQYEDRPTSETWIRIQEIAHDILK